MSVEDNKWLIELTQRRYEWLNPTPGQVEKIYAFESAWEQLPQFHSLTEWEHRDYEMHVFSSFLDATQMLAFKSNREESLQRFIDSIRESEKQRPNEIAYYQELLLFYQSDFLPAIFTATRVLMVGWSGRFKSKIAFLKAGYTNFLHKCRSEIISRHFRNYRSYAPLELEVSLLRFQVKTIVPDFASFYYEADPASRAVADFILESIRQLDPETDELLTRKSKELHAFFERKQQQYIPYKGGWRTTIGNDNPGHERQSKIMLLVLLDKDKYGF